MSFKLVSFFTFIII